MSVNNHHTAKPLDKVSIMRKRFIYYSRDWPWTTAALSMVV